MTTTGDFIESSQTETGENMYYSVNDRAICPGSNLEEEVA